MNKSKVMQFLLVTSTVATFGGAALAATVTTTGVGSAVTVADRTATFDGIAGDLSAYTEDGLEVSVVGTQCCFADAHHDSGGNTSFVTIATTDGSDFFGIEMDVGSGFNEQLHNVVWESLLDGAVVGSGLLTDLFIGHDGNGALTPMVLGWTDAALMDTLRVGAGLNYTAFGQSQAIALDNVSIQFDGGMAPVPLPASLPLLLAGLGALGLRHRNKKG